jgi:molybdopterin-guanine dinucleotide biosynthesis protein A
MASAPTVTVAILAGGAGARFGGRDKGLVELAGKPLIEWVLRCVPGGATPLIVANRNLESYARFGRVVSDAVPGHRGPLLGIFAALRAAQTEFVATLPVDCPRPPRDWFARLMAPLQAHTSINLCVAHDGRRREPLFAVYRRDAIDGSGEASASDAPVWRWQDALGAHEVDFSDAADAFANINNEAERIACEQRIAHELS